MKEEHNLHTKETVIVEGQMPVENDSRKAPIVWIYGKRVSKNGLGNIFTHLKL